MAFYLFISWIHRLWLLSCHFVIYAVYMAAEFFLYKFKLYMPLIWRNVLSVSRWYWTNFWTSLVILFVFSVWRWFTVYFHNCRRLLWLLRLDCCVWIYVSKLISSCECAVNVIKLNKLSVLSAFKVPFRCASGYRSHYTPAVLLCALLL